MRSAPPHSLRLIALSLLVASFPFAQAQTPIDVSFPDRTGTNATFLGFDSGVGGGANSWTQETGVLYSTTTAN